MRIPVAAWLAAAASVIAALVAVAVRSRGGRRVDVGAVSSQWIAEHRADDSTSH
jgi:hypothetical protein